jgi:nucleotide-binding universal stress UspA family protein
MGNVLLVIPPGVRPRAARDHALARAAANGGTLIVLVLLDRAEAARIAATLDSAFMGERVSDRVVAVLAREQHVQAEALLADIQALATARGIAFVPLIETGDADEVCARVIRTHAVREAVVVVAKRSLLSRLLSRSAPISVPAMPGCALTVMEEDPDAESA